MKKLLVLFMILLLALVGCGSEDEDGLKVVATLFPQYDFAKKITELTDVETVMQDERGTTITAHNFLNTTNTRGKNRKQVIDTVSACLILEGFLNETKK